MTRVSRVANGEDEQREPDRSGGGRRREDGGEAERVRREARRERCAARHWRHRGRPKPDVGRLLARRGRELEQHVEVGDADRRPLDARQDEDGAKRRERGRAEREQVRADGRREAHDDHDTVTHAVGEPAEGDVAGHLAREKERGEHARLGGRRVPGGERVHGVEATRHHRRDREGARKEKSAEIRVAAQERGNAGEIGPERDRWRRGRGGGLAHEREGDVRERHARRRVQEADAVAPRRRDRLEHVRRQETSREADGARGEVREGEEAPAQRHRDRPPHDVHPRRHQHASHAGDQEEHGEQDAEREPRRTLGRDERGEGQDEERRALPDRVAEHERKLPAERLRVTRGEERREEPPEGHHGGDRADGDVGGVEVRREGRQDRGLRSEREPDHEEPVVGAEGEDVAAQGAAQPTRMSSQPWGVIVTRSPSRTSTVVVADSKTAGPLTSWPAGSASIR